MGKYTALADPAVDEAVREHLQRIVEAVLDRMEPHAIVLRGSFGRGEGTIVVSNGKMRFLSDYEIDVATYSPFHRSLFRRLSGRLTTDLGVETSLRWVRPDYLYRGRVGPLPTGAAPATISLYESRYGSQVLYGQDIIDEGPAIDPRDVQTESAALLMFNRMAESLSYMSPVETSRWDRWTVYYWINKTILACAESLLLLWGNYDVSYEERGRRFAGMAEDHLNFLEEEVILCDLVARATEFKLRPRLTLYAEPVDVAWRRVIPICDSIFRHVVTEAFDFSFSHYSEFPERFLRHATDTHRSFPPLHRGALTLLDLYKSLRVRRLPRAFWSPFRISSAVYAVVPLMFVGWAASGETLSALLAEVRRRLKTVCRMEAPVSDPCIEWDTLRQQVFWAWKNFCYR
jgi:hypothetical protein